MIKTFFSFLAALLLGGTIIAEAKVTYVPLYIVDTQADIRGPKRAPTTPLFITQDGHRLILPETEDAMTFKLLQDNNCVFEQVCQQPQPIVTLPTTLTGDYEVRLCADTYYYYGLLTLEDAIPQENTNWEEITLLGSDTSQEAILDEILGLHVVEYYMKPSAGMTEEEMAFLSEEQREAYLKRMEERNAEARANKRVGLLPEEVSPIYPQLVVTLPDGRFAINYTELVPVLVSCLQELKYQLDNRTEAIVDVMSRRATPSDISAVRSAIGNTLLSAPRTSVSEPAQVRYLLTDDVSNAYIAVTDMSGRVMTRVPAKPSETTVAIGSGILDEGIFLCTLYADGKVIGTKRLVKTR